MIIGEYSARKIYFSPVNEKIVKKFPPIFHCAYSTKNKLPKSFHGQNREYYISFATESMKVAKVNK